MTTPYLHPERGADTDAATEGSPLRTLAEAARRVNRSYLYQVAGSAAAIGAGLFLTPAE